ncbi:IS1182 family transposase [Clostridium estertheticum]|uniref:IS1182 family transposase n=1 Tax=Clostridium estertheticum TaxID=238834 RepID=UPI0013E91C9E|nr:IS1182 family transposase [Clostridium estertheticum]MBZ9689171.1 IS1182 family transposase [Clostridium estertheticum]MBZ9689780.1 IS1182 family transposase [Clostridium estertheticum]
MLKGQLEIEINTYHNLYSLIIPKNNILKQINDLVDFSFVYDELMVNYSLSMGRGAFNPIMLFKYLILKVIYELSDEDVVERALYDMSFKYFLNLAPEETNLINSSTLTKFRKLRIKDMNLLDLLINKTVELAIKEGVLKSKAIIVDATHTKSRYNQKSAGEELLERAKNLRKTLYGVNPEIKEDLPNKVTTGVLEDILEYCKLLIDSINKKPEIVANPAVKTKLNYLTEAFNDDLENLKLSKDADAKVGHKTEDSSFFGYKSHLAMSEERIITAAVITTGEKSDGKELITLIEKSREAGVVVNEVIGDAAYSEKKNLEYTKENKIALISRLNPIISQGTRRKEDEFEFNKDAGLFVCPVGHMAIKKAKQGKKNVGKNQVLTYYFDVEKCKNCAHKDGCYKEGAKSKTYSVKIKSNTHKDQIEFEKSEYFKTRARQRYMIEAKNSELKHQHGYDVAISSGLIGMQMQGALSIFTVNLKRIIKLKSMK